VQINIKKGMTFPVALRAFLRQDPDVIMVGEIRDLETAEIAIKAAQTGHMVLSTLHTNDAPQTIARLMNMGIAPYNITSSVTLVIAQRLARRLHDCKRELKLPEAALLAEGYKPEEVAAGITLYEAVGCPDCNEGYKGRLGHLPGHADDRRNPEDRARGGNAMAIAQPPDLGRQRPAPLGAAEGQERHHQPRRNQPRHQGLSHGSHQSRSSIRRNPCPTQPDGHSSSGRAPTSAAPR
jgi:type IV pilus assembly protein PilB